jgi:hypothetical protein
MKPTLGIAFALSNASARVVPVKMMRQNMAVGVAHRLPLYPMP